MCVNACVCAISRSLSLSLLTPSYSLETLRLYIFFDLALAASSLTHSFLHSLISSLLSLSLTLSATLRFVSYWWLQWPPSNFIHRLSFSHSDVSLNLVSFCSHRCKSRFRIKYEFRKKSLVEAKRSFRSWRLWPSIGFWSKRWRAAGRPFVRRQPWQPWQHAALPARQGHVGKRATGNSGNFLLYWFVPLAGKLPSINLVCCCCQFVWITLTCIWSHQIVGFKLQPYGQGVTLQPAS